MKGSTSHMPSRNVVKEFITESYYHVYNRGVEKRKIFQNDNDYTVFLGLLKKYLSGENNNKNNRHGFDIFNGKADLLAYCLMPTHFHLLFYQYEKEALSKIMRRISTGYAMYFNIRYNRVGSLFQGTYKASLISEDDYLQHISRYIHLNPYSGKVVSTLKDLENYPYSSLRQFIGKDPAGFCDSKMILGLFSGQDAYKQFVLDHANYQRQLEYIKHLTLEN